MLDFSDIDKDVKLPPSKYFLPALEAALLDFYKDLGIYLLRVENEMDELDFRVIEKLVYQIRDRMKHL